MAAVGWSLEGGREAARAPARPRPVARRRARGPSGGRGCPASQARWRHLCRCRGACERRA
eukprot:4922866-Prymnesium_polylepis.1